MSRNSRWLEVQSKICELDARYDAEKSFAPTSFCSAASRLPEQRHLRLCEIYRTRIVPRKAVGSLAPRKEIRIPDALLTMPSPPIKQGVTIPNELLFPKPKRGRPINRALHRQAHALRCSKRHARRLLANGKSRQRDRERQPYDVIEVLKAREERAALVRELKVERIVWYLTCALDLLKNRMFTMSHYSELDCRLARTWVEDQGLVAPVLIVGVAMGAKSFRNAGKLLGISPATIYRYYGSRLVDLRRRAQDLPDLAVVDLKKMADMKLPKRKRGMVSRPDSAWEEQTVFRPRYEHHDS